QAEDGIRDGHVTGVQTCALPICKSSVIRSKSFWLSDSRARMMVFRYRMTSTEMWARSVAPSVYSTCLIRRSWSTRLKACPLSQRSEERRVGKECRSRGAGEYE